MLSSFSEEDKKIIQKYSKKFKEIIDMYKKNANGFFCGKKLLHEYNFFAFSNTISFVAPYPLTLTNGLVKSSLISKHGAKFKFKPNFIISFPIIYPVLFRKGRFSEIFFADLPTDRERADVINLYAMQSLHKVFTDDELLKIVKVTNGYSYADLETAIKEVSQMLIVHPDLEISMDMVIEQIQSIVPITKSNPELVESCRAWGREKAINVSTMEAK